MAPLIVLLGSFGIFLLILRFLEKKWDWTQAANIGMSCMLVFTAIGHFAFTEGMSLMLPSFIPFRKEIVLLTGLVEIIFAVGLLTRYRRVAASLLIIFFLLILPANIHAAIKGVNYQQGNYDGPGTGYLWFRVPLQLFFIGWVYFSALNQKGQKLKSENKIEG